MDRLRTPNIAADADPVTTIATARARIPIATPIATKTRLPYFSAATGPSGAFDQASLITVADACTKSNVTVYPIGAAWARVADLAAETAGQVFPGRRQAIDEARRNTGAHYALRYYSTDGWLNGRYRKVQLKLTRLGLQQAKLGYAHGYVMGKITPVFPAPLCF